MVDDDGETIAVLGAGRIAALNTTALAWQAEVSYSTSPDTGAMLITPQAGVSFLQSQVEGSGFFCFYSGSELCTYDDNKASCFMFPSFRSRLKMRPTSLKRLYL